VIDGVAVVRRYLQARGRRMTSQREAIVRRMLALRGRHLTAEQVAAEIAKTGAHVSKATLYRTLGILMKCGLFEEVDFGGRQRFYEPVIGQDHHDHLYCMRCGKIVEFLHEALEKAQEDAARSHGYVNLSHSVRIYGLCPKCAREWRREKR
jgi:Fur family ferric uptake transcriptional regulator